MSEINKIEHSVVLSKVHDDPTFKALIRYNVWFYTFVQNLERGLTNDQLLYAIGELCKSYQQTIDEVTQYRIRYGNLTTTTHERREGSEG